jgi:O-antigen/teichoic acid export membrane protein
MAFVTGMAVVIFGFHASIGVATVILLCISFLVEKNTEVRQAIHLANGESVRPSITVVLPTVLSLLGIVLWFAGLRVSSVVVTYSLSRLIGATSAYALTFPLPLPRERGLGLMPVLRSVWPISVTGVLSNLQFLDVSMVGAIANPVASALYSSASKIVQPASVATASFSEVLMPRVSVMSRREGVRSAKRILALGLALVCICALCVPFSTLIIRLLYGQKYSSAGAVLAIFLLGLPFMVCSTLLDVMMQGQGLERACALIAGIYTFLLLLGVVLGSYWDSAIGAALAVGVASALQVGMQVGVIAAREHGRCVGS